MIHLVIGGARSGKSSFAQKQVELLAASPPIDSNKKSDSNNKQIIYIATATAGDEEMTQRIAKHQQSRPKSWLLIEETLALSRIITAHSNNNTVIIIECMTLWLSNWLSHNKDMSHWQVEKEKFIKALKMSQSTIIIVSNEVGSGIVPLGELSRNFVDQAGWLNQQLAQISKKVTLVVAGCPLGLKQE